MTELARPSHAPDPATPTEGPTDAELITLVRAGDSAAYEELFRRHRDVAVRYARRISDSERAEDLAAEAFTKIFDLLQRGKGPDIAFRAYLLTTVRTSHLNALRSLNREDLVPDHEPISRMMPVIEDPDARFDQHAILRAFSQLPERWQAALWLTSVEGLGHDEVSEHLGIKPNAVASLAFRARAGLRQAFLAEHLLETTDPTCRVVVEQLPSYYRDRLSPRRRKKIEEHLETCASCTRAAFELADVDNRLGALLAPLALGGFAVSGTAAKVSLLGVLPGLVTKLPRVVGTKAAGAAFVAVTTVVAGAAVLHGEPTRTDPSADAPVVTEAPAAVVVPAPVRPTRTGSAAPRRTLAPLVVRTSLPVPQEKTPSKPHRKHRDHVPAPVKHSKKPPTPALPSDGPTSADPAPTVTLGFGTPVVTPVVDQNPGWVGIDLPVTGPVVGTVVAISIDRNRAAAIPVTAGTGWTCTPTAWQTASDGAATTSCTYDGTGNGAPLHLAAWVLPQATLTATLTPPSGYVDTTPEDNIVQVVLRG